MSANWTLKKNKKNRIFRVKQRNIPVCRLTVTTMISSSRGPTAILHFYSYRTRCVVAVLGKDIIDNIKSLMLSPNNGQFKKKKNKN